MQNINGRGYSRDTLQDEDWLAHDKHDEDGDDDFRMGKKVKSKFFIEPPMW